MSLVRTAGDETDRTRMVIEVVLGKAGRKIKALVDSGAEANCIRQRLALQLDIVPITGRRTALAAPNGSRIFSYGNVQVSVGSTDTTGVRRDHATELVSCDFDLGGVEIILGHPWLASADPVISFRHGTWRHRLQGEDIEVLSAKAFIRKAKTDPYIYAIVILPAGSTSDTRRVTAVRIENGVIVPFKYRDLEAVFSLEEASLLPVYYTIEHRIDIEPGS